MAEIGWMCLGIVGFILLIGVLSWISDRIVPRVVKTSPHASAEAKFNAAMEIVESDIPRDSAVYWAASEYLCEEFGNVPKKNTCRSHGLCASVNGNHVEFDRGQGMIINGSLLAVDPGPSESAFVVWKDGQIWCHDKVANAEMLMVCKNYGHCKSVFEMIASYGKPVGQETFETCVWIGRFMESMNYPNRMFRRDVTKHLCGNSHSVKDGVIRQRMIDLYSNGQGKGIAIGLKKSPGPLYGFKEDEWQALALGVTFGEQELGWKVQE